ncbi:MAG: trypsin-like peptidase domain-containing protein [Eubacteriales bacterium]|nr:trypsin-like peptidase domain-containing protein [Eubacteriales bacterium]
MNNNNYNDFESMEGDNFIMRDPGPDESEKKEDLAYIEPSKSYENRRNKPKEKSPFVTKKVFTLTIILCVFFSSALSFGAFSLASNWGDLGNTNTKNISATNYNIAKATGSELSVQEIVAKNENSVVEIRTESVATDVWMQQYVTEGAGSGVIIDADGYIITNNHVIDGASKITVTLHNGAEYQASLVATDSLTDIAVIKIKAKNLVAATYGDSSKLSVGDLAIAIGNPLGELGGTATSGIISALDRELTIEGKKMTLLQVDASINPGNSGGGLFNQYGQLVGLVVAKSSGSDVEGLGFAIPSAQVSRVVSDLIKNGHVTNRPSAGIKIQDLSSAQAAMQQGYRMTGVYIAEVVGENAKKAGFRAGDMLYYIEDTQIDSAATLLSEIQSHKVGDTVKFTVIRDNKTVEIKVKLSEAQ